MRNNTLAVSVIRGVSFESFMGPGVRRDKSACRLHRAWAKMATAITTIPYRLTIEAVVGSIKSILVNGRDQNYVAPVVVSPEIDSNKASIKLRLGASDSISGSAPKELSTSQKNTVTISRLWSLARRWHVWRAARIISRQIA